MAAAGQGGALAACLLDFESFPGRYALALREPRLLFDRGTEILQLASGRAVEGMPQDPERSARLRTAARFFVRTGLLRAGVDHYTLLGLVPRCTATQVRDHYRLLMRLTHPDFAGDGQDWPADAATRINQANDVLSSPERRRDYDRTLPRGRQWEPSLQGPAMVPPPRQAPRPLPPRHRGAAARPVRKLSLVVAALAVIAAGWWLFSPQEPEGLSVAAVPRLQPQLAAVPPQLAPGPASLPAPAPAPVMVAQAKALPAPVERSAPAAAPASAATPLPLPAPAPAAKQSLAPAPATAAKLAPVEPSAQAPLARPAQVLARQDAVSSRLVAQAAAPTVQVPVPGALPVARAVPSQLAPAPARPIEAPTPARVNRPADEGGLGLRPATTLAAVPPVPPVPAPAPTPVLAPATASPPVATVAAVAPAPPAGRAQVAKVTMAEVQPMLGQLLDVLGSGRGEQIHRWVDRSGREGAGADGFVQTYTRMVANGGKVRLGPVQFSGRQEGDGLVVDGVVILMLQDENRQPVTRELVLKAQFVSRGGQPVMTQVTASELAR